MVGRFSGISGDFGSIIVGCFLYRGMCLSQMVGLSSEISTGIILDDVFQVGIYECD